jgi:hypothetical protein
MASAHLPHVWVLAAPIAPVVIAANLGSQLRSYYADLLMEPAPEYLDEIVQRLSMARLTVKIPGQMDKR